MKTTDKGTRFLVIQVFVHFLRSLRGDPAEVLRFMAGSAGLLFFVGNDVVKITMRKNVGIYKTDLYRFIFDFFILLIISVLMIGAIIAFLDSKVDSFLFLIVVTTVTYVWGSIFFLRRAIKYYRISQNTENKIDLESNGESNFLSFLNQYEGWDEHKIEYRAEPLYFIILGLAFCCFNILGGLPLIYCGISVWGYELVLYIFNRLDPKLEKPKQGGGGFNQASTD